MRPTGRCILIGLIASILLGPQTSDGQTTPIHRLAYVNDGSDTAERKPHLQAFRNAMQSLGYVEGRDFRLDARFADGDAARVPALIDEVMASKPDILMGFESVVKIMRTKTTSMPIVLVGAIDPVRSGLAQSLRRPGMNVTGSTQLMDQLTVKHIEMLREIFPRLRVGQIVDNTASGCGLIEEITRDAARASGVKFMPYHVTNKREVEQAFSRMERDRPDALMPCPSPILFGLRQMLFENAVRLRIPFTSYVVTKDMPLGVLFSYAATIEEGYARAATYVDKILKGGKPAELPIEQPKKFDLILNLKTAKQLGIVMPPSLVGRADHVVE